MTIKVDFLRNYPDCIETCANWEYMTWGKNYGWTRERVIAGYKSMTNKGNIEQAFVALSRNKPIGTVLLIENDHENYKQYRPWLAALYVVPEYRCRGIARKLVAMVEDFARSRGEDHLFLYTTSPNIYKGMGWQVTESFGEKSSQKFLMNTKLSRL
ncbi:GNAT family N-acetyltransferase [Kiloniella antarctica]|uniref:GNAT family N-acetyltransferase n=1 Tax=Kiloniella antarctica TaxID=1550907 RepID=A0ABW5BHU0_9PROT